MPNSQNGSFADIQQRLDQILDEVANDQVSLDDALALCEEAVALGLSASAMLEDDVTQEERDSQAASCSETEQDAAAE